MKLTIEQGLALQALESGSPGEDGEHSGQEDKKIRKHENSSHVKEA